MFPEIDNLEPKLEPKPLFDFYGFNQGSINLGERSSAAHKEPPGAALEMSDPYGFSQGLNTRAGVLSGIDETHRASMKEKIESCRGQFVGLDFDQANRGARPSPFAPFTPETKEPALIEHLANPPLPFDYLPIPGKNAGDISRTFMPAASGKSSIVEAYERRQGARHAGNGTLPSIDPVPLPGDFSPPSHLPGPRPDLPPWTPSHTDVDPNYRPVDVRPDRTELISKLEPKYETSNVAKAVKMAEATGLPLAVHIGASWCGYCVQMEQNTWPSVEGSPNQHGSLQGKVVVLHMDVDQARNLQGESKHFADEILKNRGQSVPLLRVFKVDSSGHLTKTAENHGALNSRSALESFLVKGGVRK